MSILFRLSLFFVSIGTLVFVFKKIRNAQMQIDGAVFWIVFMLGLVATSIFPGILMRVSTFMGVESSANFVFLCVTFIMLLKVFSLSLQNSKLKYQIEQLTQLISLKEYQERSNL